MIVYVKDAAMFGCKVDFIGGDSLLVDYIIRKVLIIRKRDSTY